MANPFFSGRIPQDLFDRVEEFCKENNKAKTEVLIEALSNYLNFPIAVKQEQIQQPEITKEMFFGLEERIKSLEEMQQKFKDFIDDFNKKKEKLSTSKKVDKTYDNKTDNILKINDNEFDNKADNKKEPKQYREIITALLGNLTNINSKYIYRLHDRAKGILKKQGKELVEKKLLEEPVEVEYKDGIFIENVKYKLFYIGQNAEGKALWNLIPDNNFSNQKVITGFSEIAENNKINNFYVDPNSDNIDYQFDNKI